MLKSTMLKYCAVLPLLALSALPAAGAVISPYQEQGCTYEGAVGKDGKPAGQGKWQCRDGRSYSGTFKNGKFDGKGSYSVAGSGVFLEPFNSNSTKFRNMTLSGTFKQGMAHGSFTAEQNGETVFVMKCENGMIKEVGIPAKPKTR